MRRFTKRFAAMAMAAGLAMGVAACEADDTTTDPAQEEPADDLGGTEGDLGGTETETETEAP